ncbi:MAG TPA: cation-transporting P-type ATPase [Polyangiales bacterium]|nr:cation-transporting P-type ATPase [Polyangiales bacterium]
MLRFEKLRALLSARPRRCSFTDGRALIEYRGVPDECLPALSFALRDSIAGYPAIEWVDVNLRLGRVVFAADGSKLSLHNLVTLVEQAEESARNAAVVIGERCAPPSAQELPDDELELTQRWVELCADLAGLSWGLVLRPVPFVPKSLGSGAVLLLSLLQSSPKLRRPLDAQLGKERADLLINLCLAQAQSLSQRPLSSVVDVARRTLALRELAARQRAFEQLRARMFAQPQRAEAQPSEQLRERGTPLSEGPIEHLTGRTRRHAMSAFGVSLLASRELGRATAAWFGALPAPALLGKETFAAAVSSMLSQRGMLVLAKQALHILDRIDTLVIDRALLSQTRLSLGSVVAWGKRNPDELRAQALSLFDPQEPLACRAHAGYQLAPLARTAFAKESDVLERARNLQERGSLVLVLSAVNGARDAAHAHLPGGQLLALIELKIAAHPGGELLVELARHAGLHVVLCTDAEPSTLAKVEGVELVGQAQIVESIRGLQRRGRSVCLMAAGDSPGLAVADCALAVLRDGERPALSSHILCSEAVDDCLLLLRAILIARRVSEQSVRVSVATAVSNTLIAASAQRRAGRSVALMSSAASLVSMANALRKTAQLRAAEGQAADATPFHALEPNAVLARLRSSDTGLSHADAARRARELQRDPSLLRELVGAVRSELDNPFTPFLVAGAGLSALVGSRVDAALVGATGLLGALLAGGQRVRTQRALRRIVRPAQNLVSVLRQGKKHMLAESDVVVGDVILLRAGEVVPADCRILESADLEVDGASLTGEALPNSKAAAASFDASLADRSSMLYAGTSVVAGRAKAVAVAIGAQTEALRGSDARDTRRRDSGVEERLRQLTELTIPVASVGAVAVMISGMLRGRKPDELIASSISLGVAALPEGLPLLATAAQLATAQRLTRHGALVRNAHCIEALGRVDVVCIDKTGTLTEGLIELGAVACAGQPARALHALDAGSRSVLAAALRATPAGELGNTTDAATARAAQREGVGRGEGFQLHMDYPFASAHGYHAVVGRADNTALLTLKGAVERILPLCSEELVDGRRVPLQAATRADVLEQVVALAAQGLRVLAVAERRDSNIAALSPSEPEGLCFLGLLGYRDPVRSNAKAAVEKLREAGVRVVMLTGDHVETARSIAREVSLLDQGSVFTGGELADWDDDALTEHIDEVALCARVTPAQKVRIVRALQERGHVVVMVGDGANDAPAMRAAQVGIAVGHNCAAAAQVAADIVLPTAGIDSLLEGILDARGMWLSIRDAVSILLGGNLGEIAFTSVAGLFSGRPPLNPRQLLLVNLLTDVAPAMAVAMRAPPSDILPQLLHDKVEDLLGQPLDRAILVRAISTALGAGWAWGVGRVIGSERRASTLALVALVGSQLGQTLGARGDDRKVLVTSLSSALLLAAIVQTPGLSHFFGCRPLGPIGWSVALTASAGATVGGALWNVVEARVLDLLNELRTAAGEAAAAHSGEAAPVAPLTAADLLRPLMAAAQRL